MVTGNALSNAQALRDQISSRMAEIDRERRLLEKELAQVNQFLAAAEEYASRPASKLLSTSGLATSTPHIPLSRGRNPRREEILKLVVELLVGIGRPMKLREIDEAVREKGVNLSGTNPVAVLGTMLWRGGQDGILINLRGLGYWPTHLPFPPAQYVPD